ncbi:hypothetical protein H2201_008650 [Coniosporium apollinis]|uniref:Heterokaryon incompatibility domain-containing protein n=1 Tax=Coniosporium apollinis TaxID=61459 RepID=A0ABQ9NIU7_9PEZI|nr:hypothetical protein H2201_008650 [Coniosporium apollinis]
MEPEDELRNISVLAHSVSIGTIKDIRKRQQCPLCRLVFQLLVKDPAILKDAKAGKHVHCFLRANRVKQEAILFYGEESNRPRGRIRWLRPIQMISEEFANISVDPFDCPRALRKQRVNAFAEAAEASSRMSAITAQINYQQIRLWLDGCEKEHGSTCNGMHFAAKHRQAVNLNLIDVHQGCLVAARSDVRYFALSYMWGGVQPLQLRIENLDRLREKGALWKLQHQIPQVIKDAMELVYHLGEQYLWVDALSIVQNDQERKEEQIRQMDVIYSQAVLTIVATSGTTANASLPGVRKGTRDPIRQSVKVASNLLAYNAHLFSDPPGLDAVLDLTHYETRAWTLQERLLSRRRLYLTDWQTYFQCNRAIYDESYHGTVPLPLNPRYAEEGEATIINLSKMASVQLWNVEDLPSWECAFHFYDKLVINYTARNLTKKCDILNALAGISSVLEESWGGAFVGGLPEAVIDLALLWTPTKPLRRRGIEGVVQGSGGSPTQLYPSWSWAGWEGPVQHFLQRTGMANDIMQFDPRRIRSEIHDYKVGAGKDLYRLARHDHPAVDLSQADTVPSTGAELPLYSRSSNLSQPILRFRTETVMASVFLNSREPLCCSSQGNDWADSGLLEGVGSVVDFWRENTGIHIAVTPNDTQPCSSRLFFRARNMRISALAGSLSSPVVPLLDSSGQHCGVLLDYAINLPRQFDARFEFVLLSSANRLSSEARQETLFDDNRRPFMLYTYGPLGEDWSIYNIMLIEWRGRNAERVAIGQMNKEIWDAAQPKVKNIRLV